MTNVKKTTSLSKEEVISKAIQYFTSFKKEVTNQTENTITFGRRNKSSGTLFGAILLCLLFFLIPYVGWIIGIILIISIAIEGGKPQNEIILTISSLDTGSEVSIDYIDNQDKQFNSMVKSFLTMAPLDSPMGQKLHKEFNPDEVIEANPDTDVAWISKGVTLSNDFRNYNEAIKCFDEAIKLNPDNDIAWNSKGIALSILRKNKEAEECFKKAKEIKKILRGGQYEERKKYKLLKTKMSMKKVILIIIGAILIVVVIIAVFTNSAPANNPPVLSSGGVSPSSGDTSTNFKFLVSYSDPEGVAPTEQHICIDGICSYMLGLGSNATYTYETYLAAGTHTYYFQFSDGTNTVKLPTSGAYSSPTVETPKNKPLALYKGSVSPSSGYTSTNFKFLVYYSNSEGIIPTKQYIFIDGTSYRMSGSGSSSTYSYQTTLGVGAHNYYFQFNDGTNSVKLPSSGTYSGPTVTQNVSIDKKIENSLLGKWQNTSSADDLVSLEFLNDGTFFSVWRDGTSGYELYKIIGPNRLQLGSDATPIFYDFQISGNTLTLQGGLDFIELVRVK